MVAVTEVVVWFGLGIVLGAPMGVVIAVLWAPFLALNVVRDALDGGPFRWWVNYLAGFMLVGSAHLAISLTLLAAFGSQATVPDILVGVPVLAGLAGALLLVRAMDAVDDVLRAYVVVMAGVLWYVIVTVVPSLVLLMFYTLPA